MKKFISFLLCMLLCLLSVANVAAESYPRNITGEFNDIKVSVNTIPLNLHLEPFIYEDEVYVPIKSLAQRLYLDAEYDATEKVIKVGTSDLLKDTTIKNLAGNLLQRDYEIQALRQQLQERNRSHQEISRLPYRKISTRQGMETYLQDYFGSLRGISMSINLSHSSSNRYRLHITFPSRDASDFQQLSRSVIETWLEDMFYAIRDLYDDEARMEGSIRDTSSSSRTYVSFDTSGNKLSFDFRYHHRDNYSRIYINETSLERHLRRNLSSYNRIDFDYEVTANRYDLDLIVSFDNEDFYDWSSTNRRNFLNRLEREIWNFDGEVDVYGKIVDSYKKQDVLSFRFLSREVDSYDYDYTYRRSTSSSTRRELLSPVLSSTVKRTVTVWFDGIGLEVDGSPFALLREPFMIGEEIYVPITDLADALYWVVEYVPEEKVLKITDYVFSNRNSSSLNSLLRNR
ncbi:hypothetical protein CACET_c01220 [Clostridium aceticum]|uniref:Uncharacterized protein n=1 Tax=Clostridium aceticum TaxID=84022 RepID=A0A0D8IA97_9CLOT|nr:hypothetical protein [Clostridium aceticum]AKL93640.1 hypothetical protein CACET_c01220 [Clostridium aceticum]KJF27220.1 hypothetical protein TZ02_09140 [Clostridium aceticum]